MILGSDNEISSKSTSTEKQQSQENSTEINNRYELLNCVSGSREIIAKPLSIQIINTILPKKVELESFENYNENSDIKKENILKNGRWSNNLGSKDEVISLSVSNKITLFQLREKVINLLNEKNGEKINGIKRIIIISISLVII
jgi:hypothetical protein